MKRHRWGEPNRPSPHKTERECLDCGIIKVSRHEDRSHWIEFWRPDGLEKIVCTSTPPCLSTSPAGRPATMEHDT